MLKKVRINKQDTCLTYAFKRVGITSCITDMDDIEKEFMFIPYLKRNLKGGDIIVFVNKKDYGNYAVEINEEGQFMWDRVNHKYHVGVVEMDLTWFSDLTRLDTGNGLPSLRMRKLSEVRKPKFILRPLQNNQ